MFDLLPEPYIWWFMTLFGTVILVFEVRFLKRVVKDKKDRGSTKNGDACTPLVEAEPPPRPPASNTQPLPPS